MKVHQHIYLFYLFGEESDMDTRYLSVQSARH